MNTENWAKIQDIVSKALAFDGEERKKFVSLQCEKFPELREEIESLLHTENDADDFFDSPAAFQYASFIDDEEVESSLGKQVGNYQIVKEIGTGGMGAVYLATRIDGNLEQKVAIKMLRREFNTKEIRQRFENEKEIQAALNHPNIAHLIDAGTTEDSIPFLVIEFIEGEHISQYCQRTNLPLKERLKLFNKVCDAVAFAHRNLVIHRDLKPSNIIVTKDGEPKLLDFGISKLLNDDVNHAQTVTKMGVMTPEYASPEQAKGESVTTATDIYSLGVILFKLLTGHRPFEKEFRDNGNAFKAIIEAQPEKPSDVLTKIQSTEIPTEEKHEASQDFEDSIDEANTKIIERTDTQELKNQTQQQFAITNPKLIKGDLDNIILKALRKEPDRRYQTVEQFSADIWRHLDGMPVSARPATFNYRASKFIKRNKVGVFASGLVLLAILGGLFATLWQARVAQTERLKAENRFNDVRSLANSILFDVYPTVEKLEGSIEARKTIVDNAIKYLDSLSKEASDNDELQLELADAYKKIGDVQGNDKVPNLGDRKGSLASYAKARVLIQNVYDKNPSNLEVKDNLADIIEKEGFVLWWSGDNPNTYKSYDEALKLRKELINDAPNVVDYKNSLASLYLDYGDVPYWENKNLEALEKYQLAFEILKIVAKKNPNDSKIQAKYAHSHNRISKVDLRQAEYKKAIQHLNVAEEIYQRIYKENPKDHKIQKSLWVTQFSVCEVYLFEKNSSEAVKQCPKIIETQRKFVESEPNNTTAKYNLSNSYYYVSEAYFLSKEFGKTLEAIDKGDEFLQIVLEKNPTNLDYKHHDLALLKSKARVYREQGKLHLAKENYKKYVSDYEALLKEKPKDSRTKLSLFKGYHDLAEIFLAQNDKAAAKSWFEKSRLLGQELFEKKALSEEDKKTFENVKLNLNKFK